ncbi:MAG: TolC family protein [Myxococcota bacterium]|nr:TolC family protein [Myxococcota bacterium]
MRKALLPFVLPLLLPAPVLAQAPGSPAPLGTDLALPSPPHVDDPMLTPVPAAPRQIASWQEAIAYVRARSTDLRVAVDQALQAEAQTRIALAAYLPTVKGESTFTHNILTTSVASGALVIQANGATSMSTRIPVPDALTGSIALQQALINAPVFDQISIDELSEDAANLSVEDQKRTLALSVANQIVSVVTAEREAEINRVGLRVALEQLAISTRKQALGAANGLDVVRAQQNAANARATLVRGDETLREARESLGLALGIPEETGVAPDVNIDGIAQSALGSCRVVPDVDQRSDVAAAHTRLEVAKRSLRNIYFQFLPTLTAASTLAANTTSSSGFPNPTWNVQAVLQVPIWDGGARYGQLRNARAAEDIAAQQLESLRRQALIQVQQAQRQLVVAELSDKVAREQRDLAATNDQMTQRAYMAGQGTSLELVTASEAHRSAELNLALQDFGVVKARILAVLALATCPW